MIAAVGKLTALYASSRHVSAGVNAITADLRHKYNCYIGAANTTRIQVGESLYCSL